MPKVSIIIPNYNHAQFLEQRIESVLSQTFQDFEIIFLDDASTDSSREVFAKYAHHLKITHTIFNEINSGSPFKQWEKGLNLATGEYIWIAESDDYCELDFLEEMISIIKDDTSLAYCRSIAVSEYNSISTENYFWPDDLEPGRWLNPYIQNGNLEIKNFFSYKNVIPNASSAIFKRQDIKRDPRILDMKYAGDWLFWINQIKNSKIVYTPKRLNYFRSSRNNTRSPGNLKVEERRFKEYFLVISECISFSLSLNGGYPITTNSFNKWHWIFDERRLSSREVIFLLVKEEYKYLFLSSYLSWHLYLLLSKVKYKVKQTQKIIESFL
jgi:glycosyltransferase involved in cell wall biosynthesis